MEMTKKHFEAIAAVMRNLRNGYPTHRWLWTVATEKLADLCAQFNPAFDRERFLAACRGE